LIDIVLALFLGVSLFAVCELYYRLVSHQTLISVGETTAIVETKAKGFQEHISFEGTAFKEQIRPISIFFYKKNNSHKLYAYDYY
jgi:hypothetical protein